jgi:sugar phosphate isomerase/epimerase
MGLTRRQLLTGVAAGAASWSAAFAQTLGRTRNGPKPRSSPAICLYSQVLIQIAYDELGPVLQTLGVDGCDLTVMPGGHVTFDDMDLHLMRAIEAITGVGLEVPVLSTSYTSLAEPTIRTMAGVANEMGIPLFRAGQWKYPAGAAIEGRLAEVQRDLSGLGALARAAGMAVAIQNVPGDVGGAVWDTYMLIRAMDPHSVGYDFDAGYAVAESGSGFDVALRLALPRIKMVTARDFYWTKEGGAWKRVACPLGDGMVDWPRLFTALAGVRFAGPASVTVDYRPSDPPAAIRRDVAFLRKQVAAAYG